MKKQLKVSINDEVVAEYDKDIRLPGKLREFLAKMDQDMDEGIMLGDEQIISPDETQRAHYVAMHLLYAINDSNDGMQAATCAYLLNRVPSLTTIRAQQDDEQISFELIME